VSKSLTARIRLLLLAGLGPALYVVVLLLDSLTRPSVPFLPPSQEMPGAAGGEFRPASDTPCLLVENQSR
jgi:hypothetical protein